MLAPFVGLVAQDIVESVRAQFLLSKQIVPADMTRSKRFTLPPHLLLKKRMFTVISLACYVACWLLLGWRATLFAAWSLAVKASRFDVIGWGQDVAEHNSSDPARPTNTTHTIWNWIFCNTGYHTEHHSFPNVPGCYLPQLSRASPEEFSAHVSSDSWPSLWLSWMRSGFKSARVTEQQRRLVEQGRCRSGKDCLKKNE